MWISRVIELITDWRHLILRDGWRSAFPVVIKEIGSLPCSHLQFYVLACTLTGPQPKIPSWERLKIRSFESTDLEFVRKSFRPSEANLCRRRLKRGDRGLVASISGRTAGYRWLCRDTQLERIRLELIPGDILTNDAFTAPEFRNKGVSTALAEAICRLALEWGYKRVIVYVEKNNAPNLSVWRGKMKAEIINCLDFKRIGFWRRTRTSAHFDSI